MATSRGLKQFSRRMKLRADVFQKGIERKVKRAALAADNAAVLTTPVDTGRARGNWLTSIGAPRIAELDVQDKSGNLALEQGRSVIPGWKLGAGPIYIANGLPYIQRLDDGSSAQAPSGMSRFAIQAAQAQLGQGPPAIGR